MEKSVLKRIWTDQVGSKVIGGLITTAVLGIASAILTPLRTFFIAASPIPNWLTALLMLVIGVLGAILLSARQRPAVVRITPVGDTIVKEDKAPGRGFPLKGYRVMRNDSNHSVDVAVADYRPGTVTLKQFVTGVLQVKLREWYPDNEGVDRLAVLPGQQFKA